MSETISRMYGSPDRAIAAVNELKEYGWGDADIQVVSRGGGSVDEIAATIMKGMVLKYRAKRYAEGVAKGGTLVTVQCPFATTTRAIQILDSHGPIDSGVADPAPDYLTWEDSAPLSSSLHMPTLTDHNVSFSSFISLGMLTAGRASLSRLFGLPELSSSAGGLSNAIGMPTLSRNPAPLSSMLKLPLLKRGR